MKARFVQKMPKVSTFEDGNLVYIQLALNEAPFSDTDMEGNEISGFEYDFHEFKMNKDEIDLEDVKANPEDYMSYPLPKPTIEDRISALEEMQLLNI